MFHVTGQIRTILAALDGQGRARTGQPSHFERADKITRRIQLLDGMIGMGNGFGL
jgi:hypothetical protein